LSLSEGGQLKAACCISNSFLVALVIFESKTQLS
jgi:hypothetical protein